MAKPQKIIDPITRREFRSLRALAIYHGFKPGVIAARLRLQWSLLHALRTPVAPKHCGHSSDRRPRKVTYKGVTYPSQRALIDALGVNPGTFYHRRAAGDSLEEALRTGTRARSVTLNGVTYPSIREALKALGVCPTTYYSRLRGGDSMERALRPAYAEHRGRQVTYEGVVYPSISALARAYGLRGNLLCVRLASGESIAHALDPSRCRQHGNRVKYGGVWYPTLKAFAGALGLPPAKAKILLDEEGKNDA